MSDVIQNMLNRCGIGGVYVCPSVLLSVCHTLVLTKLTIVQFSALRSPGTLSSLIPTCIRRGIT